MYSEISLEIENAESHTIEQNIIILCLEHNHLY